MLLLLVGPGLVKWTNYDSTGGGVTFGLPACLLYIFLPLFADFFFFRRDVLEAEFAQNFVKKCRIFWRYTEFRQLSLLFVRDARKAPAIIWDSPQFRQNFVEFSTKNIQFGSGFSENCKKNIKNRILNFFKCA